MSFIKPDVHYIRHGTRSHFVTQRPSDPGIQQPGDPVDPVTLFYNELQISTYVADKRLQWARGFSGVVSGTTVRALVLGCFSQKKFKIELKDNAKKMNENISYYKG